MSSTKASTNSKLYIQYNTEDLDKWTGESGTCTGCLPRLIRFKGHPPYHTKTIQYEVKLCTLCIMTCTTRSKFKVIIILREFVLHNWPSKTKHRNIFLREQRYDIMLIEGRLIHWNNIKLSLIFILNIPVKFKQLSINYTKYHNFNQ